MSGGGATVERALPEHFDALAPLFASYPYKAVQQKMQRLDAAKLHVFYAEGLRRSLAAGAPHWRVREGEKTIALGGLHDDAWHSQVYGIKMAKIAPWLNVIAPETGGALLEAVETEAAARGAQHLSVRIDGEDFPNLHLFESRGWRLVDVSLKFTLAMPLLESYAAPRGGAENWRVAPAGAADKDWMTRLGAAAHGGTHFRNDPDLPIEKTNELFGRWVARCAEGLAWRIDALREHKNRDDSGFEIETTGKNANENAPGAGFVIWLAGESFAKAVGRRPLILDFLLLDPEKRGGGLGPWFAAEALRRATEGNFDFCELRTSSHNQPAIACYEKIGFLCCASDFVLHKTAGRFR